jgi:hypothetical protein
MHENRLSDRYRKPVMVDKTVADHYRKRLTIAE